jgi:hypothetical protein
MISRMSTAKTTETKTTIAAVPVQDIKSTDSVLATPLEITYSKDGISWRPFTETEFAIAPSR